MANDVTKVSAGKPKIGGAIFAAPKGTTMPTDSTTALSSEFKCLGYVSEDGLTNANSPSIETIKAWGGDTVLTTSSERPDTFSFKLLEILNVDVLKFVYGSTNVTGTLEAGIEVKVNNDATDEVALVIDMILRGNATKRICVPDCSVTEVSDITYVDNDAVGYETTVTAIPDSNSNTHYEYIKAATT